MSRAFDAVRRQLMQRLSESCPDIRVEGAFAVEYQEGDDFAPRLRIAPAPGVDSGLSSYLADKAAMVIEGMKNTGAKEGLYVPKNDGRFYIEASVETLASILQKEAEQTLKVESIFKRCAAGRSK